MMQRNQDYGYTPRNYRLQVGNVTPKVLLGDALWNRRAKDEKTGKYTGEVTNVVMTCYYPGLGSQQVYLPAAFQMPKGINDLDDIELINPTGCFGQYNRFYVKADGIKLKA